jgi:lipoic acid synthetase
MILGNVCTRDCRFCAVVAGKPDNYDENEPVRVADALERLGINDVVLTSVTRDDLTDGGAMIWHETIRLIKSKHPDWTVEALIPDFGGNIDALELVLDACPDVLSHNVETVPSLYTKVRPMADYNRSLQILRHARTRGMLVKSAIMVGLGESDEEVYQTMEDIYHAGAHIIFIGQYLRPTKSHLPVTRYLPPAKFDEFKNYGYKLGFEVVEASPLVRSSFPSAAQSELVRKRKVELRRTDEKNRH